jgi:hypothetical protein
LARVFLIEYFACVLIAFCLCAQLMDHQTVYVRYVQRFFDGFGYPCIHPAIGLWQAPKIT